MDESIEIRGFDFHCHVDLHPDPPRLIRECQKSCVAVLAVTTTPKAWPQNRKWTQNSKYVHAAAGLHPELVGERFAEIDLLERAIADTRLVGEVGLDGSPQHRASYSEQQEVFRRSLIAAQKQGNRVVTIHSRRAARDVIDAIEEYTDSSKVLCILHWFTGSVEELRRATLLGCYFSVNSAMLGHDRGVRLVSNIPRERLLTETDSPFTSVNGRKSGPLDSIDTAELLSRVLGSSHADIQRQLALNARTVFLFAGISI